MCCILAKFLISEVSFATDIFNLLKIHGPSNRMYHCTRSDPYACNCTYKCISYIHLMYFLHLMHSHLMYSQALIIVICIRHEMYFEM